MVVQNGDASHGRIRKKSPNKQVLGSNCPLPSPYSGFQPVPPNVQNKSTLPETNSSPMKIPCFLVNTIKMVDFPWLC